MNKRYSVAEAKNLLPSVIHEAEEGEPIEITRHGRPVVVLLSCAQYALLRGERPDPWSAYERWRERGSSLTDEDVDALRDSGREREPGRIEW